MPAKARSKKPKLEGAELALRKASLFLSEAGPFRLSVAVFTHPVREQHWLSELHAQAEKDRVLLTTIPVPADESVRAFDLARADYEAHPAPPGWTRGLILTGISARLPDASVTGLSKIPTPRMAAELNLDRELFLRFTPCPVIIALTPTALSHLTRYAPDFMQWCAHIFDFTEPAHLSDTPPARGLMELQASRPGTTYANLTELQRAEGVFRDGLASAISVHGPGSPNTIEVRANLANVLDQMGRTSEALTLSRENLRIAENTPGYPQEKLARDLNQLGQHLHTSGQLTEAEPLMRRALAIDEATFGKDHPEVAIRLNNLAQLLKDKNRLAEAEPHMRRALAIMEASLGQDHPHVATALNNLAQLHLATNRLPEAELLYRRALAIDETSFGKDHPKVAVDLNNLALLLRDTHRLAEAEPLMRRALAIFASSFGKDHPNVAVQLNNLALLLEDTSRLAEAEPLMRRHLEIFVRFTASTGHPHPHLKQAIDNYGGLLMQIGRTEAEVRAEIGKMLEPVRHILERDGGL